MSGQARVVTLGIASGAAFLASILAANYLTDRFGFVGVGFGYAATAGTFAAGFALAFRDALHDTLGKRWTLTVIALGASLSFAIADPFIAIASATAFLLSELADFAVYSPLRKRTWVGAVAASNAIGAVIDTVVFVGIAFGAAAIAGAMPGQLVGKAWATVAYLAVGGVVRALLRESQHAKGA